MEKKQRDHSHILTALPAAVPVVPTLHVGAPRSEPPEGLAPKPP